jgi:hypothetical protein
MNDQSRQLIVKVLALTLGALLIVGGWWATGAFKVWSNDNGGFVTAIGLFLVVPCSIWSARYLDRKRRLDHAKTALELLTRELWHNLNYVSQIEESYHNNFPLFDAEEGAGVHVPHFGPRVSIIEKFITVEHLSAVTPRQRDAVLEIYAQLCTLREEFPRWRDCLSNQAILNDRNLYVIVSSTILSIISPLMRNMVWLWADTIVIAGQQSFQPQIQTVRAELGKKRADGKSFLTGYKSSEYKTSPQAQEPQHVIVCWVHDWIEAPIEVVDLHALGVLHESWRTNRSSGGQSAPQ